MQAYLEELEAIKAKREIEAEDGDPEETKPGADVDTEDVPAEPAGIESVSNDDRKIRIAGVPEHFNLPWHIGIESGEFRSVDVDAEFAVHPGGTGAMMKSVADNDVDIAIVLTEGCIQAICGGTKARIVKTFVRSPLIWGIHVPESSDLHSIDDIRGQRYAISRFGSGSHLMAIVDAAERGWETDLDFAVVKNLDGAREAMAAGEANVFFWERYTTSPFVENGEFRRLDDRLTPWPAFVVCVSENALANKGDAIKALLDQVNLICERLAADAEQTKATICKRYKIAPEKVAQWWKTTQWSVDWNVDQAEITKAIAYLRKLNLIEIKDTITDAEVFQRVTST